MTSNEAPQNNYEQAYQQTSAVPCSLKHYSQTARYRNKSPLIEMDKENKIHTYNEMHFRIKMQRDLKYYYYAQKEKVDYQQQCI
jgi:hypothetical protein